MIYCIKLVKHLNQNEFGDNLSMDELSPILDIFSRFNMAKKTEIVEEVVIALKMLVIDM